MIRFNSYKTEYNNEKGQVLLFIIVAMTVALSVGIGLSTRTASSLRRTSNTDTSARAFAAAEGGIEWFLKQPLTVLLNLSDGNNSSGAECPSGTTDDPTNTSSCVLTYQPQAGSFFTDSIGSKAIVTVTKFNFNNTTGTSHYWFLIPAGEVKEVALRDYLTAVYYTGGLNICWSSQEAAQSSAIEYIEVADTAGVVAEGLIQPQTITGSMTTSGHVTAGAGLLGYSSCYNLNISTNLIGIRLKSLYAPSKVAVIPAAANFPTQGYKIVSVGKLSSVADPTAAAREIIAYKSLPYAPAIFDYVLYSKDPISN